jgi:hypothetical protein
MNQTVLCECTDWRQSVSDFEGIGQHSFILDLCVISTGEMLVKYLNCNSTTKNRYTVKHNGDFAKLYRLALGSNPIKRFSEAQHLVSHFLGCRFFAQYTTAIGNDKKVYLKVVSLKPEKAILSDTWTSTGMVKKARKARHKIPETYRNITGDLPETYRNITGKTPDAKTLQAQQTLHREPLFNPTQSPQPISNNAKEVLLPRANFFNYSKLENESTDDFHNRVIDESFTNNGWN